MKYVGDEVSDMQQNISYFQVLVPWRSEKVKATLAAFAIRLLSTPTHYDRVLTDMWFQLLYDDFSLYV